jgi:hypothetical protein
MYCATLMTDAASIDEADSTMRFKALMASICD